MTQAKVKVVKKKKPTSAGGQKSAKCRRARERNQNNKKKQTTKNLFRNPLHGAGAAFRLVSAKVLVTG